MRLFSVEHHHFIHLDKVLAEALDGINKRLGALQSNMDQLMLDTSKLLAAVARENTLVDSLLALVDANTKAQGDVSAQLTTANATIADLQAKLDAAVKAGDPAALQAALTASQAQVSDLQAQLTGAQADLDKATADLSTESAKAQNALDASVPKQAPPASAPAAAPEPTVPPDPTAGPQPMGGQGAPAGATPAPAPTADPAAAPAPSAGSSTGTANPT